MEPVSADLRHETDAGLMLLMGAASDALDEQALARGALRELHRRHYGYLRNIIEGFAENMGTVVIDPEDFTCATFKKAFRSAHQFRDESDGDSIRACAQVRAWLGKIASNLAKDELKRVSRIHDNMPLVVLEESRDIPECVFNCADAEPTHPTALSALQKELDLLKPEDRDILMTYAMFGIPTTAGRELPQDVRIDLECRTGYERSHIRKKWQRLSQRLKAQLEPLLPKQ